MKFDKIFQKVLTLSAKAVLNFINGLFGTFYPLDSKITYNWTEFGDDRLRRILADTILTINGTHSYQVVHHKELEAMKDMTDESFMTAADIICETYERKLAEKDEKLAKKDEEVAKQSAMIKQLQQQIEQLKKK